VRYFPAFFDIKDKPVLIVGGGELALRKARLLAKADPRIVFVATEFDEALIAEFGQSAEFLHKSFSAVDTDGDAVLVIAATGDAAADEAVAFAAKGAGVPVNVVDRPELCDFVVPSIVERGDLAIGISTGGNAPVLGRQVREKLEALLPQRLGGFVSFAGSFREAVTAKVEPALRRRFWENVFSGTISDLFLSGREADAREEMVAQLNRPQDSAKGFVHIVGAGPGDPELLTLKALRILQEADVVLHDALVSDGIMEMIRRDAERVYVGKKKSDHSMPQEDIGTLMVKLAREGKRVVRLKGGDPFIFGRGGEELEALKAAGIPAAVVPGITAATGCGAASSVPLTHRDHAQAVTFVTGHAKGDTDPDLNWQALVDLGHTLVVYMGVGTATAISRNLVEAGMDAATPAAVIEKGSLPEQKIIRTRLDNLGEDIVAGGIEGPAVLIIGAVAAAADGRGLVDLAQSQRMRA